MADDWGAEGASGRMKRQTRADEPRSENKSRDKVARAAGKNLDSKTGYYAEGDYMKNVAKASRQDQQKSMRDKADEVAAGYGKKSSSPAPKAAPAKKTASAKKPVRRKSSATSTASSGGGMGTSKNATASKNKPAPSSDNKKAEYESAAPKEAPTLTHKYSSPNKELANLPEKSVPRRKGKLRRAASAVGRGFRSAFKRRSKPQQAQKQDKAFGKRTYRA